MSTTTTKLPGAVVTGLRRSLYELLGYWRSPESLFFSFLLPVLMLLIFGTAFSGEGEVGPPDGQVTMATLYLPAMITSGILLSGTQSLASEIAIDRQLGIIKRLSATPLPMISYFIGKFIQVLLSAIVQSILIIVLAITAFQVKLPTAADSWLLFSALFLLGLLVCSLLGIALSSVPRSAKSVTAVVIPPVLLLQFVSGIYLPPNMLPNWLLEAAGIFPVKWIAQGMREVFLPEAWGRQEPGGNWGTEWVFIALGVWAIIAAVLCKISFRWSKSQ